MFGGKPPGGIPNGGGIIGVGLPGGMLEGVACGVDDTLVAVSSATAAGRFVSAVTTHT